jgi:hypothetical protein
MPSHWLPVSGFCVCTEISELTLSAFGLLKFGRWKFTSHRRKRGWRGARRLLPLHAIFRSDGLLLPARPGHRFARASSADVRAIWNSSHLFNTVQ